ncbi:MAG: site-specific DNA-methyltransferase [Planctomycetales bacterium]|nr:site-specific DNA-methyltransferase [Planctomycetales bacterium]
MAHKKNSPGRVRDAIVGVLEDARSPLRVAQIIEAVQAELGSVAASSVRSYLNLNTPSVFVRERRGVYRLKQPAARSFRQRSFLDSNTTDSSETVGLATLINADCLPWMERREPCTVHAILTDPPYGLHEYSPEQQQKLRDGRGGVWRIPPSFDGHKRSPLPRFTTLDERQLHEIADYFQYWATLAMRILVPGANVVVASNPMVSHIVSTAMSQGGLERRGEIVRLTMTMRGGDRPKGAHDEFDQVSVMPRSMWEPWLVFRKPIEKRVQDNLRKWKTGGFRRPCHERPFGDVISSSPTRAKEKKIAPHPSLKPQAFLRQVARGILPMGEGVVLDPFAGAGSTLAACNRVGYSSIGIELDAEYFRMAIDAIPLLEKINS